MTRKDLGFIVFFICLGVITLCLMGILSIEMIVKIILGTVIVSLLIATVIMWVGGEEGYAILFLIILIIVILEMLDILDIINLPYIPRIGRFRLR